MDKNVGKKRPETDEENDAQVFIDVWISASNV
jgi:hypothetical protein